jgi:hypothetical protein
MVLVVSATGCGDDGGGSSSDAGDSVDGPSGPPAPIPTLRVSCETEACAQAASSNLVYFAYVLEDCSEALASPGRTTRLAGRGAVFECAGGRCTGSSDDSPANWEDDDDTLVGQLPSGNYGATAWLDHNGNLLEGRGPDAGDTLCCRRVTVESSGGAFDLVTADCVDI